MVFTQLKKEIESAFAQIQEAAEAGEMPQLEHVGVFVRLARLMQTHAAEEWAGECEDFVHLAAQLHRTVKNDNVQDAILLVEALNDARNYCHRTFKA